MADNSRWGRVGDGATEAVGYKRSRLLAPATRIRDAEQVARLCNMTAQQASTALAVYRALGAMSLDFGEPNIVKAEGVSGHILDRGSDQQDLVPIPCPH